MKSVEFIVRTPMNKPDVVEVRYDCDCGCRPRARYQRGSGEAGHDQCCCGRVHFVGTDAQGRLEAYLQEQGASGEAQGSITPSAAKRSPLPGARQWPWPLACPTSSASTRAYSPRNLEEEAFRFRAESPVGLAASNTPIPTDSAGV